MNSQHQTHLMEPANDIGDIGYLLLRWMQSDWIC
jgi:hypothetical protein